MTFRNRVTEQPPLPSEFWIVSAEWRGGHDSRKFLLENIHTTRKAAQADWERLTPQAHNQAHNKPDNFNAGFVRHSIRHFTADTENKHGEA